jgi:hypothetical protein
LRTTTETRRLFRIRIELARLAEDARRCCNTRFSTEAAFFIKLR